MSPLRDDWTARYVAAPRMARLYAEELFPTTLVPVCVPAIGGTLHTPAISKDNADRCFPLTRAVGLWCEAVGPNYPNTTSRRGGVRKLAMAMQAVLDGVGVAIAQVPYVSDALAAGQLITRFRSLGGNTTAGIGLSADTSEGPDPIGFPRLAAQRSPIAP